jgi:hypothetical protein
VLPSLEHLNGAGLVDIVRQEDGDHIDLVCRLGQGVLYRIVRRAGPVCEGGDDRDSSGVGVY